MQNSHVFSTYQNHVFIVASASCNDSRAGCHHKIIVSFST
nr:MAG TPA: hypothetical protein [Caudoviricetes sp.]